MQNQRLTGGNFHTFVERVSRRLAAIRSSPREVFRGCAGNHFEMLRASLRDAHRVRFKTLRARIRRLANEWSENCAQASVVCAPRFSRLPLLVHFFLYMIFRRYVESAPPPFWIWLTHPRVLPFLEHCEAGGSLAN